MALLRLWQIKGLGLIILYPSGVNYCNQTGGIFCVQSMAEGVYLPISDELSTQDRSLMEHFTGDKWHSGCAYGIDEETADIIDQVLSQSIDTENLKVDRSRLKDCLEAWIYVDILPLPEDTIPLYEGFEHYKAILTWSNSD